MRNDTFVQVLSVLLVLVGAASVKANFVNGGFESPVGGPTPANWNSIGDASIGTSLSKAPYAGSQFGYASTSTDPAALSENSSTVAQTGAALTASLNLPAIGSAGGLRAGTITGSAFTQTLLLAAGDIVNFAADFATYTGAAGDYAFYSIRLGAGTASATAYIDTTSGSLSTIVNGDFSGQPLITRDTDWRTYAFSVGAAGSYTLGFGVGHSDPTPANAGKYSAVGIDAASISPLAAVTPLPSVALGGLTLIAGLGVLQIVRRRRIFG